MVHSSWVTGREGQWEGGGSHRMEILAESRACCGDMGQSELENRSSGQRKRCLKLDHEGMVWQFKVWEWVGKGG